MNMNKDFMRACDGACWQDVIIATQEPFPGNLSPWLDQSFNHTGLMLAAQSRQRVQVNNWLHTESSLPCKHRDIQGSLALCLHAEAFFFFLKTLPPVGF